MHRSQRPADDQHPFGHGKELYFWTLIVAVVVFALGGGMSVYEGLKHIQDPEPLKDPLWNYIVLGISILFEGASGGLAVKQLLKRRVPGRSFWRTLRTSRDPAIFTSVFENGAAVAGLLIALVGVWLGHQLQNPYFDGGASLLIGLLLAGVAILLVARAKQLIVGEGVGPTMLKELQQTARRTPGVVQVRQPLTMYLGPDEIILALDVDFEDHLTATEVEHAVVAMEEAVRAGHPRV